jgi:hypothetical protein
MAENEEKSKKPGSVGLSEETQEHLKAARTSYRESVKTFLPDEFFVHRRNARREMLLAARSMIDSAINRFDETSKG